MVRKMYHCEVCGIGEFNEESMVEHEKIPVKGQGYHGLILREEDRTDIPVFVVLKEIRDYAGRSELDREHNAQYNVINVYHHSPTKIALRGWHSTSDAEHIEELTENSTWRELTEDEFAEYATGIEARIHPPVKLTRTHAVLE
jgi:hypothetical protein